MLNAPAMSKGACLALAVLAGGRSERFGGRDKASLALGATTILGRILDAAAPHVTHRFAVGDRFGAAAAAGLDVVDDLEPDAGALGGIYTAVALSPCDRTLVVACDMPFLTTAFIGQLAALSAGADVVMPRDAHGYQPLCAIYGRACAAPLRARLARGERHAAAPPPGVRVMEVEGEALAAFDPEGLLFVNVNTPHEYERARRMIEQGRAPI
jgi:molybdopterin-guanine dinucleotide biosynthesis protein A